MYTMNNSIGSVNLNPIRIKEKGLHGRHSEYRRITIIEGCGQTIEVDTVGRIVSRRVQVILGIKFLN